MKVVAVVAALLAGLACGTPRAEPVGLLSAPTADIAIAPSALPGYPPAGTGRFLVDLPREHMPSPLLIEISGNLPGSIPLLAELPILPDESLGPDVVIPIPEPSTWITLLAGLAMFVLIAWRRLRSSHT